MVQHAGLIPPYRVDPTWDYPRRPGESRHVRELPQCAVPISGMFCRHYLHIPQRRHPAKLPSAKRDSLLLLPKASLRDSFHKEKVRYIQTPGHQQAGLEHPSTSPRPADALRVTGMVGSGT